MLPRTINCEAEFVKELKWQTAEQEAANVTAVADQPFAAPGLRVSDNCIVSSRGHDLLSTLNGAVEKDEVREIFVAALRCLELFHEWGGLHLDAKAVNFICSLDVRDGASTCAHGDIAVYLIDWESAFLPRRLDPDVELFNHDSDALIKYGRQHYDHYDELNEAYRYDVHSLCASVLRYTRERPETVDLLDAVLEILQHEPSVIVGQDNHGNVIRYTEYLTDPSIPIMTIREAMATVDAFYMRE